MWVPGGVPGAGSGRGEAGSTGDVVATLAEPFQRGTERIRTDHAGVGLGLAIVQRITQAHDGALTVAGRPGGGLRVTVELPPTHFVSTGSVLLRD